MSEMKWRTIDSAPQDGSVFLAWFPLQGGLVYVAHWNPDNYASKPRPLFDVFGWIWGRTAIRAYQPTHWMPLPDAPNESKQESK